MENETSFFDLMMERVAPKSACAPKLALMLILLECMGAHHLHADPTVDGIKSDIRESDEAASLEKHRKWRSTLPGCAPEKSGLREDWPGSGEVARLRGVLKPGPWACTLKKCLNSECCNPCSSQLKFIPRGDFIKQGAKAKGRYMVLAGESYPLEYSGMDCAVDSLRKLPLLEVEVSGKLDEEGTVKDADICAIGDLPGASPSRASSGRPERE